MLRFYGNTVVKYVYNTSGRLLGVREHTLRDEISISEIIDDDMSAAPSGEDSTEEFDREGEDLALRFVEYATPLDGII